MTIHCSERVPKLTNGVAWYMKTRGKSDRDWIKDSTHSSGRSKSTRSLTSSRDVYTKDGRRVTRAEREALEKKEKQLVGPDQEETEATYCEDVSESTCDYRSELFGSKAEIKILDTAEADELAASAYGLSFEEGSEDDDDDDDDASGPASPKKKPMSEFEAAYAARQRRQRERERQQERDSDSDSNDDDEVSTAVSGYDFDSLLSNDDHDGDKDKPLFENFNRSSSGRFSLLRNPYYGSSQRSLLSEISISSAIAEDKEENTPPPRSSPTPSNSAAAAAKPPPGRKIPPRRGRYVYTKDGRKVTVAEREALEKEEAETVFLRRKSYACDNLTSEEEDYARMFDLFDTKAAIEFLDSHEDDTTASDAYSLNRGENEKDGESGGASSRQSRKMQRRATTAGRW